ncbi:MAG TPA: urease accessory protein UreF, partial [Bradyrhizobium sp.]|nr:urease accessory protein UreF [Bradyrhizobium sp.]
MITVTIITMTTITMTSTAITTISTAIPMLMSTSRAPPRSRRRAVAGEDASCAAGQPISHPQAMEEGAAAALYRLMTWLSPSFPVGAFSYSSGIEWAVETGDIRDAASLRDWLAAML